MIGDLAKTNNNAIPTIYDNSTMTKLMKEAIGANALCVGVFSLQNNNYTISSITFKMMKLCSRVQNFPIVNDVNALGLLKKFRIDIAYYSKFKGAGAYEMKPPIISKTQNEIQTQPNIQPVVDQANPGRLAFLEKENARLEQALKESEEEKQNLLKALAAAKTRESIMPQQPFNPMGQMGNMPPFMPDKYDVSDKLLHIEDDITEVNEIMGVVNKLNDKFKTLEEERKVLAEEIENLRANNQNLTNELNRVQQEALTQKTNIDNEIFNLKELLNSTKNELDYMRNEAEKYRKIQADLLLEIDEREVQYKKQLEDKEREIEMKMLDISQNEKRRLESEMREATRKLEHYGEENNDLNKTLEELKKGNQKLMLQVKELKNTLRDALTQDKTNDSVAKDNLRLVKLMTDNENELVANLGIEKAKTQNLKEKLKKMRTYGRKARNIALDYFPPNEEIPDMLTKDLAVFLEDAENESVIQFLEYEIRSLRERNKKLEYENTRLREDYKIAPGATITTNTLPKKTLLNSNMANTGLVQAPLVDEQLSEREIQKKILEELNRLKSSSVYPQQAANANNPQLQKETDKLRIDNTKLTEENKRLKTIINETSVQDTQNTRDGDNPKSMKMKIAYLEKAIEQLEKERTELMTKCTMAEEQLRNFQAMFETTTNGYQKKILELNKRLEAQNIRLNQGYANNNFDDL